MGQRKKQKQLRGSSTPGKSKGQNCQRSQLKNLFAYDTKLHKTNPKLHLRACEEVSKQKGNYPTQEVIAMRQGT
jgi:hypothetical protein